MSKNEINEQRYSALKKALEKDSQRKVAEKTGVGRPRLALIAKSKSYKSYLQLRRNAAKRVKQNTPAKPAPGKHDLKAAETADNRAAEILDEAAERSAGVVNAEDEPTPAPAFAPPALKMGYPRRDAAVEFAFWALIAFALFGFVVAAAWVISRVF